MTMLDTATGQPESDWLLPTTEADESTAIKERKITEALILRKKNNPQEADVDIYNRTMVDIDNRGAQEVARDELSAYKANKQRDVYQNILDSTFDDVGVVQRNAEMIQEIDDFTFKYEGGDGTEQALTDNEEDTPDSIDAGRAANMGYAFSLLEEKSVDKDWLDTAWEYVTLLAPDAHKDLMDVTDSGFTEAISRFEAESKAFRQLHPDMQAELVPSLVDKLYAAYDDNTVKTMAALSLFMDGNTTATNTIFGAFDMFAGWDIAKIGVGAYTMHKAAKMWRASRSAAVKAASADNITEAARLQAMAAQSEKAAKAVGTTKADAARSIDPTPQKALGNGTVVDDIAGEMDVILNAGGRAFPEHKLPVYPAMPTGGFKTALRQEQRLAAAVGEVGSKGFVKSRTAATEGAVEGSNISTRTALDRAAIYADEVPVALEKEFAATVEQEVTKIRAQAEKASVAAANKAAKKEAADLQDQLFPSAWAVGEQVSSLAKNLIKPTAFSTEEINLATQRAYDRLKHELHTAGKSINSLTPIAFDNGGVTYRVSTQSGVFDRTMRFTKDDKYVSVENLDLDAMQRWGSKLSVLFSPDRLLEGVSKGLVSSTMFAGMQSAVLKNNMSKLWKSTEKGLSRKENMHVNAVLQAGDEAGTEMYTIAALRGGVDTHMGKFKFSEAQISSYMQKRQFFRSLHKLQSARVKEALEFDGHALLKYTNEAGEGSQLIGKRLGHLDAKATREDQFIIINSKETQVNGAYVTANAKTLKEEGYEFVQLLEAKGDVNFALVKSEGKWQNLPSNILHYTEGYVPRIYRKGYYFVRDMNKKGTPTRFAFETKAQADAFVQEAKLGGDKLSVFSDKEFTTNQLLVQEANAYGGLVTGTRKKQNPQLWVGKDESPTRLEQMDVGDSIDRYINNIASVMPINEYRLVMQEEWKKQVNAIAAQQNRTGISKHANFDIPAEQIDLPKEFLEPMLRMRDYIKSNMRMNTQEEVALEGMMLGIANKLHGKPWAEKTRNWVLDKSDARLSDYMKGQTFNLMMGWFNFRQVFVQMQNATLAMSMYPIHGTAAVGDAMMMRTLLALPDHMLAEAIKKFKVSDEVVDGLTAYKASGLRDSISRQGDYGAHVSGSMPVALKAVKKVSESGRMFFNEGENLARLITFNVARRKYLKANKGQQLDVELISKDTARMQMNLQTENAAPWQHVPVVNLATQFLQVQAKFLENVLPTAMGGGTAWSRKEKMSAGVGQFLLYGVVGVPVAQEAVAYLANINGQTPDKYMEENPNIVEVVNEGFVGMIADMLGAGHLSPSESFSLVAGLDDNIVWNALEGISQIFNGGYTSEGFVESLTGPSATTARRFYNAVDSMWDNGRVLMTLPSGEAAYGAVIDTLDDIGAMTSTWSYIRKLRKLYNTGNLMSTSNKVIATEEELGGLSLITQLGIAMGIPTDIEVNHYKVKEFLKRTTADEVKDKQELREAIMEYASFGNADLLTAKKFIILADYTPEAALELFHGVFNAIYLDDSDRTKALRQAIKVILEGNTTRSTSAVDRSLRENK